MPSAVSITCSSIPDSTYCRQRLKSLYSFPTVSFHMGDESCTIDLATQAISPQQLEAAERLANEVIAEDRPVEIRFATPDEARTLGVRKIPPAEREKLRLIDMRDFDLNACGGTHVRSTGQIGGLLVRKTEKVKQGVRVEFVCGLRAVRTARRDFQTLTDAAAVFSAHIWDVPQQVRKSLDEIRKAVKAQHRLLEEVAELQAAQMLHAAERGRERLWNQAGHAVLRRPRSGIHQDAGAEADQVRRVRCAAGLRRRATVDRLRPNARLAE